MDRLVTFLLLLYYFSYFVFNITFIDQLQLKRSSSFTGVVVRFLGNKIYSCGFEFRSTNGGTMYDLSSTDVELREHNGD